MGLISFPGRYAALALVLAGTVAALVLVTQTTFAQTPAAPGPPQTVLTMPPTPLLPQRAAGLTLVNRAVELTGPQAATSAFGGPDCAPGGNLSAASCPAEIGTILKEDGLTRLSSGGYSRLSGGAPLAAFALEFTDATGAYSAYTFYRTLLRSPHVSAGDVRLGKVAGETTLDAEGALVWAGTAVLRVQGHPSASELEALRIALPKVGGRRGLSPLLPTYLPAKGLASASARYALGPAGYKAMNGVLPPNLLAWDKSAEALTAEYAGDSGKGSLTLLLYPTPQIAGDRGRAIEKVMAEGGTEKFGTVKLRRIGPLLGLATGALTAVHAESLVESLHLTQDLTYDKPMPPEFHAEIRKTYTLLQEIAVFCGLGILASIVIGAFLGGARAGIRVLRGKPAASEPEFLTINLRDEPKHLFASKPGSPPSKS